jgi:hypothetical protein
MVLRTRLAGHQGPERPGAQSTQRGEMT